MSYSTGADIGKTLQDDAKYLWGRFGVTRDFWKRMDALVDRKVTTSSLQKWNPLTDIGEQQEAKARQAQYLSSDALRMIEGLVKHSINQAPIFQAAIMAEDDDDREKQAKVEELAQGMFNRVDGDISKTGKRFGLLEEMARSAGRRGKIAQYVRWRHDERGGQWIPEWQPIDPYQCAHDFDGEPYRFAVYTWHGKEQVVKMLRDRGIERVPTVLANKSDRDPVRVVDFTVEEEGEVYNALLVADGEKYELAEDPEFTGLKSMPWQVHSYGDGLLTYHDETSSAYLSDRGVHEDVYRRHALPIHHWAENAIKNKEDAYTLEMLNLAIATLRPKDITVADGNLAAAPDSTETSPDSAFIHSPNVTVREMEVTQTSLRAYAITQQLEADMERGYPSILDGHTGQADPSGYARFLRMVGANLALAPYVKLESEMARRGLTALIDQGMERGIELALPVRPKSGEHQGKFLLRGFSFKRDVPAQYRLNVILGPMVPDDDQRLAQTAIMAMEAGMAPTSAMDTIMHIANPSGEMRRARREKIEMSQAVTDEEMLELEWQRVAMLRDEAAAETDRPRKAEKLILANQANLRASAMERRVRGSAQGFQQERGPRRPSPQIQPPEMGPDNPDQIAQRALASQSG